MSIRGLSRRSDIDRKKAESVLFPITAFLYGGGLSKQEATSVFSSVYDRAVKTLHSLGLEYIGHTSLYADVISLWIRDKRFLDKLGRPRELLLQGKASFRTLVRLIQPKANPKDVLSILIKCGNVRRTGKEKYALVQDFFKTDGPKTIAFEPNAYFLSDAGMTLWRMFIGNKSARFPKPFWRKADTYGLSDALARKFSDFARERTLLFVDELDDWLKAHEDNSRARKARRRVGVGVFSIFSDPEINNPGA